MVVRRLFNEPWFQGSLFEELYHALNGTEQDQLEVEGRIMSSFILKLLEFQKDGELFNPGLYDFYAFCQKKMHKTQSQILQDLWVLYMLKEKTGGFFVEFGACDGLSMSNTSYLEHDYGWTGILSEPDFHWHDALRVNRSCVIDTRCVADVSGNTAEFLSVPEELELSRMKEIVPNDVHERSGHRAKAEEFSVETVSLNDLLQQNNAPREIDYMSIDTEGSEYEILKNFDFDRYSVSLFTIEHAGEEQKREKIRALMEDRGYARWRTELSRWDDWYCRMTEL